MPEIIKYIDLCCGIGGFRVALNNFEKLQSNFTFKCVLSSDIKTDAILTYNENFKESINAIDIYDINDIPVFDMLCAGFPCQPFSSAGNKEGFEDKKRGGIIFKVIELCQKYSPRYVILENVSNLISINDGKDLERIKDEFIKLNYKVSYKLLNSKDFGVPQSRERVFIVCIKDKEIDLNNIKTKPVVTLESILDKSDKTTKLKKDFHDKLINLHNKKPIYGFTPLKL